MATNLPVKDVETDHQYDGIKEFDNPMPRWWLLTFYGAIVFSFGYWFYYHTVETPPSAMSDYVAEMAEANAALAAQASQIDGGTLAALVDDPAAVEAGKAIYATNCVACHAAKGEGMIGPNLTDAYWVHGGSPTEIFTVISKGVLAKGMPAWGEVLGYTAAQQATAYVLSLKGTNVPGKAAEGIDENGKAPGQ